MSTASTMNDQPIEWLTAAEAAAHVKAKSVRAFYYWLRTHPDFPVARYGADIRIDRAQLDAYLRGLFTIRGAKPSRRGRKPAPKPLHVVSKDQRHG